MLFHTKGSLRCRFVKSDRKFHTSTKVFIRTVFSLTVFEAAPGQIFFELSFIEKNLKITGRFHTHLLGVDFTFVITTMFQLKIKLSLVCSSFLLLLKRM